MNNLKENIDSAVLLLKKEPISFNVHDVKTALRNLYLSGNNRLKDDLIKFGTHESVKKEQWQSRVKVMMRK